MDTNRPIVGALTYPTNAIENVQVLENQPRQPQNLQGLLRFAMEATKAEDAPGNSSLPPLDQERKRFLEEALKSLTVDVAKVLQDSIKVLSNIQTVRSLSCDDELPDEMETAFNNLLEYIDDIDISNDFFKLGGYSIFPICYGSENARIRSLACHVLAELCQNNPYCQARALECGLLPILLSMLESEQSQDVLSKTIYALSCCTRDYEPNCREFIKQGGCPLLMKALKSPHTSVRTKSAFLITYYCQNYPEAKKEFLGNNLIPMVTEALSEGRNESSEHLLSTLYALIATKDPEVIAKCRSRELGLHRTILDYLKEFENETEFVEERDYCKEIVRTVFGGNGDEVSSSDVKVSEDCEVER